MDNWIDLKNLPKNSSNKISWKDCDHNLVLFCYRGVEDSFYIKNRIDCDNVLVLFHNELITLPIQSIQKVCLGKLYGFAVKNNYHYKQNDLITRDNCILNILDQTRIYYSNGKSSKGYVIKCSNCNSTFKVSEANLERGDGCPICSNHQITVGINDLWSTRPDIAMMLKNKDEGYQLMQFSNVEVDLVCTMCGKDIGKHYIHNVSRFGVSCPYCGSATSYPNRLMSNLLLWLNEDYQSEVIFDWCTFPNYFDSNIKSFGRYDFVVENKKLIIEMDGGFGHGNEPHPNSRYTKEELIYRDNMKDELAKENGYKIIRIDCNYSSHNRLEYCSKKILASNLNNLYKLDDVDWYHINEMCI